MGDIADDLTDEGYEQLANHMNGRCDESDCPHCRVELHESELKGVDWSNDSLFYTHTWDDETSQFDTHPSVRWSPGLDCYMRDYKCRVPIAFRDCEDLRERFIEMMIDNYPGCKGFWVD